jgi:AIR synthase-related protein
MTLLHELVAELRAGRGFAHKRDIGEALGTLVQALPGGAADLAQAVAVGDDCAAILDGDGYLLFAIEGFVDDFVQATPWFAGWSGVMVNLSDIAAMGGRPVAVVDALWSRDGAQGEPVLKGLAAAAAAYRVPLVGGHTNHRSARNGLAVAVLGRAQKLLSSFNARPGDRLLMAVDLRGAYEEPQPFWNAATSAPPARLRGDLELLPQLAEAALCDAAKDISMAGPLGTALMLLEASQVGAAIDLGAIPLPAGVPLQRWLQSFPSFGFILSVRPAQTAAVIARFAARGIACADIGEVRAAPQVLLHQGAQQALLWDIATEPFIAARVREAESA